MEKKHWKILLSSISFIVLVLLVIFKVIPDIEEGHNRQVLEEHKKEQMKLMATCLEGCTYYEIAIPYDENNSRITYFDHCANDCNDAYPIDLK